jgi:hypothetical protein
MKEDPSQDRSLKEWIELFSDPALSLSTIWGKGDPVPSVYSRSVYLALWLEFFLVAGQKSVIEKWALLSFEEQIDLGIELSKCYLFQPLYLRLSRKEKTSVIKKPLKLESRGKLFRVEYGTGEDQKIEFLYPLDHTPFWPDMFGLLEDHFFSSEKTYEALKPWIILSSFSRLEKIRHRAETLSSYFIKVKRKEILEDLPPEDPSKTNSVLEDYPGQVQGDILPPEVPEPNLPAPPVSEPPSPLLPIRRKKKKKSSMDQMELF